MPPLKDNMTNELLIAALLLAGGIETTHGQALTRAGNLCTAANVKPRGPVVYANDGPVRVHITKAPPGIKRNLRGDSSEVIEVDRP